MKQKIYILSILLFSSLVMYAQTTPQVYLYKTQTHGYCLTKVGNELFYIDNPNAKLYKTDGSNPPVLVKQLPYVADGLSACLAYHNCFYFSTIKYNSIYGTYSTDIWKSDGTTAGTTIIKTINRDGTEIINVNDSLFFLGADYLYKNSANGALTGVLAIGDGIGSLFSYGNYLMFLSRKPATGQCDLKAYNILTNSVSATIISSIAGISDLPDHVLNNDTLFLCGPLYYGTYLYKINPGTLNATVIDSSYYVRKILGRLNNKLLLDCSTNDVNFELYTFDLSTRTFQLLKEIYPGNTPSNIVGFHISNWNTVIYFGANDSIHGTELWVTDGTSSGTHMVREIIPGADGLNGYSGSTCRYLYNDTLHFNLGVLGWTNTKYYIATKNSIDSLVITSNTTCSDEPVYWAELNGKLFFTDQYGCGGDANIYFINKNPSPGIQATNVVFNTITGNFIAASWTTGYKGSAAVFIKADSIGTAQPINNTTYTANSVYGLGTQIGTSGWYCVYNGSNTSVTITGLQLNTTYRVMVCAYNGTSGAQKYNTYAALNNPLNVTTYNQNYWTQKTDFGGTARRGAVGFSIGNKGYIGTGVSSYTTCKDFWQFDPATNSWTQKADFGGTARYGAVGFSNGSKGYIGTGYILGGPSVGSDFWEYDPTSNSWTQKANFGGTGRAFAVGFAIGVKGYIGTGYDQSTAKKDFWEYDPATDSWAQRADFGGTARNTAVGFANGNKGYIGTGYSTTDTKDFWEYDPASNSWTQKANFGGAKRESAVGFAIGTKGYIGTGRDSSGAYKKDLWEYDPLFDTWTRKADFLGAIRNSTVGFAIGDRGYIGTGYNSTNFKDFYEYYDPGMITNTVAFSENNEINIYPNPANNHFTIETPQKATIEILNMQGQLLKTLATSGNKTNVDVSAFPCGVYFIQIATDQQTITKKLIVTK
jgi:ELWxxDGT repeat protein